MPKLSKATNLHFRGARVFLAVIVLAKGMKNAENVTF